MALETADVFVLYCCNVDYVICAFQGCLAARNFLLSDNEPSNLVMANDIQYCGVSLDTAHCLGQL